MLMLKTTISSLVFAANKIHVARIFGGNKVDVIKSNSELKFVQSKTRKSESQKSFKSKKTAKIGNLPKFATRKVGLSFLISKARITFNR